MPNERADVVPRGLDGVAVPRWGARVWLRGVLLAAVVALAVALVFGPALGLTPPDEPRAWGWDETMHAELPAVQMLLHAKEAEWWKVARVIHDCDRYPFLAPVALAFWHGLFGLGQDVAGGFGVVMFLLVVLGTGRLAQEISRGKGEPRPRLNAGGRYADALLLSMLLALSSPLARRYAPTTFLELPALVTIAWGLRAWLIRRRPRNRTAWRDLMAGLWLLLAFFTKFNYALLLIAAIGLDALAELWRERAARATVLSLVRVAAPLACGLVWWFLLPFPMGAERAAEHREAFASFMTGNFHHSMPVWVRRTNWLRGVAAHTFVFVFLVPTALWFVIWRPKPGARTLGIALVAFTIPVVSHPFQLDRFLLPAALALWVLGGASAARWLDVAPRSFAAACGVLLVACLSVSTLRTTRLVGFPLAPKGSPAREFQGQHVTHTLGVFGPPASNGLTRKTHEALLDLIATRVGPNETIGWLGQSSEMSPAALHLGLLERGGSRRRFLDYAGGPMDIVLVPGDKEVAFETIELVAFGRSFDRLVMTFPGDLKDRELRSWIRRAWHKPLIESGEFEVEDVGTVYVDRPVNAPMPIDVRIATPRPRTGG